MPNRPPVAAYLALIAVCFFWGTVYLGIRIALESFSPVLLMGIRFLSAGVVVLLVSRLFKAKMPSRKEFAFTSLYGVITLGVGIGTLFFAIQWIPSGLAAMLTTTSPFWMIGIEALLGGDRPNLPTIAGTIVGLVGTLILVTPGAIQEGFGGKVMLSFIVLQIGCGAFALGSILERRHATTTHPIVNAAVQELATGIVFLIPALFLPDQHATWNWRGVAAISYLFLIGGVVGYSAYIYAMKNLPVSLVSVYTYVNPVVAVILGSLIYGEKFSPLNILAMLVIFAGVLIVKQFSQPSVAGAQTQNGLRYAFRRRAGQ
jgi:drug/metabolite transporter (DMT)-like permease